MQKQAGFTLVELVVVIIILGVLAATALPKFIDVNDKAHNAALSGTGGSFGTAVALVRAQWIANGHSGTVDNLAGFGSSDVDTNTRGWPTDADTNHNGNPDNNRCTYIWKALLQNPPSVSTSTSVTVADYYGKASGTTCVYRYNAATGMSITYDSSNGAVTVDDTP